jgi:hypothetical protein
MHVADPGHRVPAPGTRGTIPAREVALGSERKTPVHLASGATPGPTEPHRAPPGRMGLVQKITPGGGGRRVAPADICCVGRRWRWANNPLALPSKHPIPADC